MTGRSVTLTVLNGPSAGRAFTVPEGAPRRFGATAACEAVIDGDPAMAAAHFAVRWEDGAPRVRSLQTRSGTWLNGRAVDDAPLAHGDNVFAGSTHLVVHVALAMPEPEAGPTGDPRADALALLRAQPGRLYAVLDAAREDRVRELMRRTSYRRACLYDGWGEKVFGEAAPWLVHVWKRGRLVEQLVEEGMGRAWGVFLTSRAPFLDVRRQCRRLLLVRVEGQRKQMLFRWYDPGVMASVHPHMERAKLHGGVVDAWIVESREGDRLVVLR